jgi:predicted HicB family RNase H-like nuclease
MKNTLKYKSYLGTVEYSNEDNCLYGKIIGIDDLVNYEAQSVEELKNNFKESIEDYLTTCKEQSN